MYGKRITKFLLITLIFFIPPIAEAKDTCRKSDEVCRVSNEDVMSHEEGIFLGREDGFPVVLNHNLVDSTDSVVSATGLSISTTLGLTDIQANTHLKLEKSKPAELGSDFNRKDSPSLGKHLHETDNSMLLTYRQGSAKGSWQRMTPEKVPGIDKIFILLIGVLFVLIILICLRKYVPRQM